LSRQAIYDNAHKAQDQNEFNELTDGYLEQHRILTERITELEDVKHDRRSRAVVIDGFIRELRTRPLVIDEFDERLWMAAVERVTVGVDGEMVFGFKCN